MATMDDVQRIARALPGVEETVRFRHRAWRAGDVFAWERPYSKADIARESSIRDGELLAIKVGDEGEKRALVEGEPDYFFTIEHFIGYDAVLIELGAIPVDRLAEVLEEAYRTVTSD